MAAAFSTRSLSFTRSCLFQHYEGFVFNASLTGGEQVERPKVIFNQKTKTYVRWSKIMHSGHQVDHSDRMAVVAVSKKPTGPFTLANGVQWFPPDNPARLPS